MYIKLLSVIAIIEIAGGTIFSVLGIIKMSFKDVVATQTCIAFDTVDESNLLQRYYFCWLETEAFFWHLEPAKIRFLLLLII